MAVNETMCFALLYLLCPFVILIKIINYLHTYIKGLLLFAPCIVSRD